MADERLLWTGPYGASLCACALAGASTGPSSLWIAASPLSRDQVRRELGPRSGAPGQALRVWCWDDFWRSARHELEGGRAWLSEVAAGSVFGEAIHQARQAGELAAIITAIDWPGYRRQLRARIGSWTENEWRPRGAALDDPVAVAEWAVFVRYRALLEQLGAECPTGFMLWMAGRLGRLKGPLSAFDQVTFLDWEGDAPAQWRALEHVLGRAQSVRVTLAYDADAASAPVYEANATIRARFRALGFDEVPVRPETGRPAGLRELERALFRQDVPNRAMGRASSAQGLAILGAPRGEGVGRLIAREVRARLDEGADPEDILVLFPQWGEPADIALEIARDWGLPVHAEPSRPLGADPAVAALVLAIGLPIQDWVTDHLIRLLRNGQVRPEWPGAGSLSLAEAASVIKTSSVFRGREQLSRWLERTISDGSGQTVKARRARLAEEILERVFALLAPLDRPRRFAEQVDQLVRVFEELGLGRTDRSGLDQLRDALEDQADVLDRLGRGTLPSSWAAFVREVESLVVDLEHPVPPSRPGSVRMAAVYQARGAEARFVVLADLAEGSFPSRDAVKAFLSLRPGAAPDEAGRLVFSREMLRFLGALGSARSEAVLIYPTTDAKGQDLLHAGFLDELMELLSPEALAACHRSLGHVGPALLDAPNLAGSPGDHRIRATALARTRGDLSAISNLASQPAHRRVLEGTAAALQVLDRRSRDTPFGEYDGLLSDGNAVLNIAESFPPEYRFSASQLETYIACPFQFFCKYVLKLEPTERRDEIDEDYTERGSQIHQILEALEQSRQHAPGGLTDEQLVSAAIQLVTSGEPIGASEVDLGLDEIERRRLAQTVARYVAQREEYENQPQARVVPHLFEVEFGKDDPERPFLEIGQGLRAVRLQGKIDRIDLVDTPEGRGFRVIDYKSGAGPSATDVGKARLLQLPLYAMAVERIILPGSDVGPRDVGYWAIRKDGYKPIAFENWQAVRDALGPYVAGLVERLRRGVFVVDSQLDGCESFCDFRAICRVRQARLAAKRPDRAIPPELSIERARGAGKRE